MPGLAYPSMESCLVSWHTVNGEVTAVPVEVEGSSVDVPGMYNLSLLLGKDVGWTQDVSSVYLRQLVFSMSCCLAILL